MSEDKKAFFDLVPDSVDNAIKNIADKPTQNIGTTLADIWYLVFGGISQAAEKRKLKYTYALQEFEKELKEKESKISIDKLVESDIQVIAQALDAAKYCVEKEELRKLFVNLVSSSINNDLNNYIHPSYPNIIKQLSPEDARLLKQIYTHNYFLIFECPLEYSKWLSIHVLESNGLIENIGTTTDEENLIDIDVSYGLTTLRSRRFSVWLTSWRRCLLPRPRSKTGFVVLF